MNFVKVRVTLWATLKECHRVLQFSRFVFLESSDQGIRWGSGFFMAFFNQSIILLVKMPEIKMVVMLGKFSYF